MGDPSGAPAGAPAPDNGEGTAFAAGVAAATAAQAAQEAEEAERTAETAEAIASGANERAAEAETAAWDARAAVDDLRAELGGRLDDFRNEVLEAVKGAGKPEGQGPSAPAPERGERPAQAAASGTGEQSPAAESRKSKKRTGYGARSWFGDGD